MFAVEFFRIKSERTVILPDGAWEDTSSRPQSTPSPL